MKHKIAGLLSLIILLFVMTSGIFSHIVEFLCWLVTLNMTQSKISLAGEIFVKIVTWLLSYGFVGLIFNKLDWFNKGAMKFAYLVISTLLSFALCYVIMLMEKYLLHLVIVTGALFVLMIIVAIVTHYCNKRKIAVKVLAEGK